MLKETVALGMLFSFTALLIFFGHLYLVKVPADQARNQHTYEQAASAPENLLLICPPSHDGKPIAPEQCKLSGQYEHDRRQQILDHNAQVSMKHAAWWTVAFTFIGLILVSLTLIQASRAAGLAVDVLREAKDATRIAEEGLVEAKLATIAANETVEVTRDMGVAQTRAYLIFKSASIEIPVSLQWKANPSGEIWFMGKAILENIGNTPSYATIYKMKVLIQRQGEKNEIFEFGDDAVTFGGIPHGTDTSNENSICRNIAKKPAGATVKFAATTLIWITFRCEYLDVFGNKWFVESTFDGHAGQAKRTVGGGSTLTLKHRSFVDKYGLIEKPKENET